jgi:hypothetical protein
MGVRALAPDALGEDPRGQVVALADGGGDYEDAGACELQLLPPSSRSSSSAHPLMQ